jgi:tRNA-dihydrouridine synthase 3
VSDLRETLVNAALVMAPMTKGSNLPYRRLAAELGARVIFSEMVVARRLKQRRRAEFALVRRAPGEPYFAVQLAGTNPEEMAWAAVVAEARGADLVDVNLGCPIDHFTRIGLGAALARQPNRVRKIVRAMADQVKIPVTVKIRLGWNASRRNYLDVARAAVDGGAAGITVHGRAREARYRHPADWDAIAEVAAAMPVPVIGNGDLLFPHEVRDRISASGCTAVMTARGALIKPWIFTELARGYWDITADERLTIYRRYVRLAREHWGRMPPDGPASRPDGLTDGPPADAEPTDEGFGRAEPSGEAIGAELEGVASPGAEPKGEVRPGAEAKGEARPGAEPKGEARPGAEPKGEAPVLDDYGRTRFRQFLRWHVGFWCRYAPQHPDGTWPTMQQRESAFEARSPLEALFARTDDPALDYVTDQLLDDGEFEEPPPACSRVDEEDLVEAG